MPGHLRGFDEFFGPCDCFVLFDSCSEECRADGDRRSGVEVVVLGGPPECDTQVCKFGGEPVVGVTLTRAVPQLQYIGFAPGEVVGVRGACLVGFAVVRQLFFGELPNGFQHREPGPP